MWSREGLMLEVVSRLGLGDWASVGCACSSVVAAFRSAASSPCAETLDSDSMDLMCGVLLAVTRGADVAFESLTSRKERTVLTTAAVGGRPDVVRWMLQAVPAAAAAVMQPDKRGARALHYAALEGHAHVCEVLLQGGADPDVADHTGLCPLHLAAESGSCDTCLALLRGRASVSSSSHELVTPLLLAVQAGHEDVCRLLSSEGADPHAVNVYGHTPMALAHVSGGPDMVASLESAIWGKRKCARGD